MLRHWMPGACLLLCHFFAWSQPGDSVRADGSADSKTSGKFGDPWRVKGEVAIALEPGISSNWNAGLPGQYLGVVLRLRAEAIRKGRQLTWLNQLEMGYGETVLAAGELRKAEDRLALLSYLYRDLTSSIQLGAMMNFRTQFSSGYDDRYLQKYRRRISGFFAPAYLFLGLGAGWHFHRGIRFFLSPLALRLTIVSNRPHSFAFQGAVINPDDGGGYERPLSVFYGVDPSRQVRPEFGIYSSAFFSGRMGPRLEMDSRLDLYSNYLYRYRYEVTGPNELRIIPVTTNMLNIDIFWTGRVRYYLRKRWRVAAGFDLQYDDDARRFGPSLTGAATGFRAFLGLGGSLRF